MSITRRAVRPGWRRCTSSILSCLARRISSEVIIYTLFPPPRAGIKMKRRTRQTRRGKKEGNRDITE
jgi:hypothetical protein